MNKLIFPIALLGIALTSCEKDPIPNPDGTFPGCTELSGTQSTAIILTNHVTDPAVPDYCISGTYFVEADLVVQPGVFIQMNDDAKIHVRNGGSFKSVGTAAENIKIIGEDSISSGQWVNIHFSTTSPDNELIHTNIYGGGNSNTYPGMVFVGHQGSAFIDNCGIYLSSTNGIMTENVDAGLLGISNCDFTLCGLYPINVHPKHVAAIESSISGIGNTYDLIEVRSAQLQDDVTWNDAFFPYHVNSTLGVNSNLIVQPGTAFFFAPGASIQVGTDGSLNCLGTPTDRIRFRSDAQTQSPGSWVGVVFVGTTNPLNRFDYCDFSYGGGGVNYNGMITLWSNAYARVGNSSFSHSAGWGVYYNTWNSTFDNDGNNTWTNNVLGDFN
jgi:hypothetical protein